jgi:hypothetical protein
LYGLDRDIRRTSSDEMRDIAIALHHCNLAPRHLSANLIAIDDEAAAIHVGIANETRSSSFFNVEPVASLGIVGPSAVEVGSLRDLDKYHRGQSRGEKSGELSHNASSSSGRVSNRTLANDNMVGAGRPDASITGRSRSASRSDSETLRTNSNGLDWTLVQCLAVRKSQVSNQRLKSSMVLGLLLCG